MNLSRIKTETLVAEISDRGKRQGVNIRDILIEAADKLRDNDEFCTARQLDDLRHDYFN